MRDQSGVTLLEAIMLVAIVGMFTVMSIPRISSTDEQTARAVARRIIADMRYTRQLAISDADDYIVRFSPAEGAYTEYRILRVEGETEELVGQIKQIPVELTCTGPEEFTFTPLGSATGDGVISLAGGGDQHDISVIAVTGRVY
jgi:hypothetical protein